MPPNLELLNPLSILPLLLLIFFIYRWLSPKKNLPPSPPSLPILENLHQLGTLPFCSLHALSKIHRDLMLLRLGSKPNIIISSVDVASKVLKTHDLVLAGRPNLKIFRRALGNGKDMVSAPYGEYWMKMRSICMLHLLNNKKVRSFRKVRKEEVAAMINDMQEQKHKMEMQSDIVIVGAGISGLSTALGLHRLGLRSTVLEASSDLRVTGFAFTSWSNAWAALDALGLGDLLRQKRPRQQALVATSAINGKITSEIPFISSNKGDRDYETRCLERRMLAETLANELPQGSIRFSSKVVSIEESDHHWKLLHLADGCTLKAKVLIGCDGVNSIVGRWLGLEKPHTVGKFTIRGHLRTPIERKIKQFMGDGVKYGIVPINDNNLYWFLSFAPNRYTQIFEVEENPEKIKQFVLSRLGKSSEEMREFVEETSPKDIICSRLKTRYPWEVLWGQITKGNVCVAGDAFHPMTPDLGQGACSSLEDGVILARCLGRAMVARRDGDDEEKEYQRIKAGLEQYAKERKWRAVALISTSYVVGTIELSSWRLLQWLRDGVLAPYLNRAVPRMGDYDCGMLN